MIWTMCALRVFDDYADMVLSVSILIRDSDSPDGLVIIKTQRLSDENLWQSTYCSGNFCLLTPIVICPISDPKSVRFCSPQCDLVLPLMCDLWERFSIKMSICIPKLVGR